MARYLTLSIDDLDRIIARLSAAMDSPRTANRDQVRGYLIAAIGAWMVAMGEVRG